MEKKYQCSDLVTAEAKESLSSFAVLAIARLKAVFDSEFLVW